MSVLEEVFLIFVVQDDLASEISVYDDQSVQPDKEGRYGFNVRVMYTRELMEWNECRYLLSCRIGISHM